MCDCHRELPASLPKEWNEMLDTECESGCHEVIYDDTFKEWHLRWRWRPDPAFIELLGKIDNGALWDLLRAIGISDSSKFKRKLYKLRGESLFGFYNSFYNPEYVRIN